MKKTLDFKEKKPHYRITSRSSKTRLRLEFDI